jgi:NTP pyrophosphatase (non-canonical NTP hydrolase)
MLTIAVGIVCFALGCIFAFWLTLNDYATDRQSRQWRVGEWCVAAFGKDESTNLPQRGLRLLEEAAECAQACGVEWGIANKLMKYVWGRPPGSTAQELGGVQLCCLALAEAAQLDADECELREVNRVLAKPLEHFAARNKAKNDLGFLVTEK